VKYVFQDGAVFSAAVLDMSEVPVGDFLHGKSTATGGSRLYMGVS
jgi:hypothetical protein